MNALSKKIKYLMLLVLVVTALFSVPVYADYGSWVRGTDEYKNARESFSAVENGEDDAKDLPRDNDPNPIEKFFAELVVDLGSGLTQALKSGGIDASTTGIIMGKFTNDVNYFVFDLSSKGSGTTTVSNPWGMIGAYLYVLFRSVSLSLILVIVAYNICRSVIFGNDKSLNEIKEQLYTLILFMVLLYIMPQIVDWICEARDLFAIKAYNWLDGLVHASSGLKDTISLEQEYYKMYADKEGGTPSLLNAAIYLGICIIPFFYIISYIGIALTETLLFGCFPLVLLLALSDKKALHSWCVVVFTNLLVPMIDMILILLPSLIIQLLESDIAASGKDGAIAFTGGMLKAVIVMTCFMLIMPTRNKLLSVLGNSMSGIKGGFGLGALAGLGLAAAKGLKALKGGGSGGDKEGGGGDGDSSSPENESESQKDLAGMQKELGEISGEKDSDNGTGDGDGDGQNPELQDISKAEDNDSFATNGEGDSFEDDNLSGGDAAEQDVSEYDGEADGDADGMDAEGDGSTDMEMGEASDSAYSGVDAASANVSDIGSDDGMPPDYNEGDADLDTPTDPKLAESELNDRTLDTHEIEGAEDSGDSDAALPEGSDLKTAPGISEDIEGSGGAEAAGAAQAEAQQAIADATVKNSDLEKQAGIEGSLAKDIADYSPTTKGDNPNFDRDVNMSRAANLQSMDNLRNRIDNIDKDNSAAQASIQADNNTLSQNMARLDSLDKKEGAILDKYQKSPYDISEPTMSAQDEQALGNIRSERAQLQSSNEAARENIANAQSRMASNNVVKQNIQSELGRRSEIEKDFGAMQGRRGMNSQTYTSAKDFARSLRHDSLVRQTANYKNFASAKYNGVLTPQERTQFRRQQNIRRAVSATAKVAGGAALVGAGGVAMVALSVGGESGVAAGAAIAGYGAGQVASATVAPAVGAVREAAGNAATVAVDRGSQAAGKAARYVGGKAAAVNSKLDNYFLSEKWVNKDNPYRKQNRTTRKERDARTATGGSQPKPSPTPSGTGTGNKENEAVRLFGEQYGESRGNPTSNSREREAVLEANKNKDDFNGKK